MVIIIENGNPEHVHIKRVIRAVSTKSVKDVYWGDIEDKVGAVKVQDMGEDFRAFPVGDEVHKADKRQEFLGDIRLFGVSSYKQFFQGLEQHLPSTSYPLIRAAGNADLNINVDIEYQLFISESIQT